MVSEIHIRYRNNDYRAEPFGSSESVDARYAPRADDACGEGSADERTGAGTPDHLLQVSGATFLLPRHQMAATIPLAPSSLVVY
jgi:hypothetical protein